MYTANYPTNGTVPPITSAIDLAPASLTAALFVDFDNIYRALENRTHSKGDQAALVAQCFAAHPERWLAWIEQGMPCFSDNGALTLRHRSALIRRCYLNPGLFGRYRQPFSRAAFSVIDCPHLANHTGYMKNSADMYMVLDILDTLEHKTHFDEFIIFSGDSDFTPVLLRLRAHNRRTTILTIGQAVEAYKAAADRVIRADTFLNDALDFGHRSPGLRLIGESSETLTMTPSDDVSALERPRVPTTAVAPAAIDNDTLGDLIIAYVRQLLTGATAALNMADLANQVRKMYGERVASTHWAGAGSFKRLLMRAQAADIVVITAAGRPGFVYDPARHARPLQY